MRKVCFRISNLKSKNIHINPKNLINLIIINKHKPKLDFWIFMEGKLHKLLAESKEIVEFKEPTGDISVGWVLKNGDLLSLEEGIPILDFSEQAAKRNKEMEFRVFPLSSIFGITGGLLDNQEDH